MPQIPFIRLFDYAFVIFMVSSEYIRMYNPELYNKLAIRLSFLLIRWFSSGQLVFIKARKTAVIAYNTFVESYPQVLDVYNSIFPKKIQNDIEFVLDGKIVFSTTKEKVLLKGDLLLCMPSKFDFIIYSKTMACNNESVTYKKIITRLPVEENQFEIVKADYKFVLTEMKFEDKVIVTNFSCYKHNYFVVGNVFDLPFLKYYLNHYHANELEGISIEDIDVYLRVLDQNVNTVVFDSNNQLKINKDNYEIKKLQN
jgi:hypothetical protein